MAFTLLRWVPSVPIIWRVLIINGCWILSKAFSASIEMIIWFLSFNFLIWCITLIDLHILKNPCIPGISPIYHGIWAFWYVAEFCLPEFCWGLLHLCSSMILAYSFLFCVLSLSGFGIRVIVASQNEFGSVPSSAIFWKSFRRIGISSSLNVGRL